MLLRPYQEQGFAELRASYARGRRAPLYVLPTGGGKCFGRGTPVLMFNGTIKPVEDVVVGDWLMGPDSRPRRVLSTCRGRENLYRVAPTKGSPYVVNESHILSLRMTPGNDLGYGPDEIVNLTVRNYLAETQTFRHCAKGWRTSVDFTPPADVPEIPPYILGVWLGDGTSTMAAITSADEEITCEWTAYAMALGLQIRKECLPDNKASSYHAVVNLGFQGGVAGGNALMRKLRHLRVLANKHIPHRYMTGTREERLDLLAGLIDTDGSLARAGFDFINKNRRISEGVAFVARSLGLAAYISECTKSSQNGATGRYFRVSISGETSIIPCRVSRKRAPRRVQKKNVLRTGIALECLGEGEYFGFEIDGDRLFLLGDFTVVHNTVTFSHITAGAARKGNRVMILAHRAELIDQISGALDAESVPHGFVAAGYPKSKAPVLVASVQTLIRRVDAVPAPDLIVTDEGHHATETNTYGQIFKAYPNARRLGVTATPCRLSGEALGDVYDDLVLGPSVQELTDAGYLARARIFAPPTVSTDGLHIRAGEFVQAEVKELMDKPSVTGDAISHYRQHADNLPAVCFCHSIEHSKAMAQAFRDAGYVAAHIDGATSRDIRRSMIADFRTQRLRILCSVDVVSEGFDVPGIHCGILLRPTASESLYLQQVGRCLRPAPGKDYAILLDHVGSTLRHGLPTDDREWSLSGTQKSHRKQRDKDDISVRVCPKCFAAGKSGPPACWQCGHVFEVKPRKITARDGELLELTPEMMEKRRARQSVGRAKTREELMEIAKARNYHPRWVDKILNARGQRHG